MDSNRVKAGKHSWVHLGMDFGHGFVMDLAWILGMIHGLESSQSCMDFGGIVRGDFGKILRVMLGINLMEILARFWGKFLDDFWQDFGVNFGVDFEKEFAYIFRHPCVHAHV